MKLSINMKANIKSECSSFEKNCIIENTVNGSKWCALSYQILMDEQYKIYFGSDFKRHLLSFYNEVLDISEIDMQPWQSIIDVIVTGLQQGNYFIVDCNLHDIDINISTDYIQDVLIYGYDDENIYIVYNLNGSNKTKYKETPIAYKDFIKSYEYTKKYYTDKVLIKYWRSLHSNFPMTIVKPKPIVYTASRYVFLCMEKIENEMNSSYLVTAETYLTNKRLTGLSCLLGMNELIKQIADENISVSNTLLLDNFYKLYEYKMLNMSLIEYLSEHINMQNYQEYINLYKICLNNMNLCYALLMKYKDAEYRVFPKLIDLIEHTYQNEKTVFSELLKACFKFFE